MSTITMPGQQLSSPTLSGPIQNGVGSDDGSFEIVNGELVELPPMSIFAVSINSALHLLLGGFVNANRLGRVVTEAMFILDAAKKFQRKPDLAFVSAKTWPLDRPLPRIGDWQVVPDLAVEVVSPNDAFEDVLSKTFEYFSFGVKCVWVVSPLSAKVLVFDSPHKITPLGSGSELDGGAIIPGFRVKLSEIFETAAAN